MAVTLPKGERVDWRDLELEIAHLSVGGKAITSTEIGYLDGLTLGTAAASKVLTLDTGEDMTWPATGLLTYGGTAINANGAEINAACDVSARYVAVGDVTTYTFLVANSGKTHVMLDLTSDCVFTMPAAAAGLEYLVIYAGAAADGQDWVYDLSTTSNFFKGGLTHLDESDAILNVSSNGSSNDFMRILVPDTGTMVSILCDGTNWIAYGYVNSGTAPTFADT